MPITDAMVEAAAKAIYSNLGVWCADMNEVARAALTAALSQDEWQDISTAPKDGSHFLAWCVDIVDEYDEDDRIIAKGVREAYAVVAYQIEWLGGIVQFPWTGGIVRNREFTHWRPLPAPPIPTQEEG